MIDSNKTIGEVRAIEAEVSPALRDQILERLAATLTAEEVANLVYKYMVRHKRVANMVEVVATYTYQGPTQGSGLFHHDDPAFVRETREAIDFHLTNMTGNEEIPELDEMSVEDMIYLAQQEIPSLELWLDHKSIDFPALVLSVLTDHPKKEVRDVPG